MKTEYVVFSRAQDGVARRAWLVTGPVDLPEDEILHQRLGVVLGDDEDIVVLPNGAKPLDPSLASFGAYGETHAAPKHPHACRFMPEEFARLRDDLGDDHRQTAVLLARAMQVRGDKRQSVAA